MSVTSQNLKKQIREAIRKGKIKWTIHAVKRLRDREIKHSEVLRVIYQGKIIEKFKKAKPFPKYLMMDFVREKIPLYVSIAFDNKTIYIITLYWLDFQKWINPWKRK